MNGVFSTPAVQALLGVQQVFPPGGLQQSPDGVVQPEGGRQVEQCLPPVVLHRDVVVVIEQQLQRPAVVGVGLGFWFKRAGFGFWFWGFHAVPCCPKT